MNFPIKIKLIFASFIYTDSNSPLSCTRMVLLNANASQLNATFSAQHINSGTNGKKNGSQVENKS